MGIARTIGEQRGTHPLACLLVLTALVAAGCADPSRESDGGTRSPTSSTSPSDGADPPPTEEPTSTGPTPVAPDIASARGRSIELEAASFRLPEGFEGEPPSDSVLVAQNQDSDSVVVRATDTGFRDPPGASGDPARAALEEFLEVTGYRQIEKLEPVVVDGIRMFHLTGTVGGIERWVAFGSEVDGYSVVFEFGVDLRLPREDRRELVYSVMNTVDLAASP